MNPIRGGGSPPVYSPPTQGTSQSQYLNSQLEAHLSERIAHIRSKVLQPSSSTSGSPEATQTTEQPTSGRLDIRA